MYHGYKEQRTILQAYQIDWGESNTQMEKEAAGKGTPGEDYGRGLDRVVSIYKGVCAVRLSTPTEPSLNGRMTRKARLQYVKMRIRKRFENHHGMRKGAYACSSRMVVPGDWSRGQSINLLACSRHVFTSIQMYSMSTKLPPVQIYILN